MSGVGGMNHNIQHLPWFAWLAIAAILLTQGTCLFLDARRRGARAWLWGTLGLIQFPMPTLFYLLLVVRPVNRREAGDRQTGPTAPRRRIRPG